MYVKSIILFFVLWIFSISCYSQSYSYSYTDPCTGTIKTVSVPLNGGINVTLYGKSRFFQQSDFLNGNVQLWAQSVISSFNGISPCGSVIGLPTVINITQTNTLNLLSIITSISSVSDLAGSTDLLSGLSSLDANNEDGKNKKKDNSSTGTTSNVTNSIGNGDGIGSNTSEGTTGSIGTTGYSGTTGNSSNSGSGTSNGSSPSGGGGSVNLIGSSINSIQSSPGVSSKNGNRPNILASSDFVGFNFKNTDVSYGGKVSGGYTSMNWDGTKAHGILADYTSAMNGPNVTGFYAFMKPKRIDVISLSGTIGFGSKLTAYTTISVGQMWKFKRIKKLKAVWMITGSYGSVYEKPFFGTAFIAGSMYDLKVSKRIEVKLLGLYVYAPYVKYYNDIVLKSPNVILPIIGTNIGITKRFKFNVNIGGAYAINVNTLNYTIMFGTRMLL
jgi:hypothetical protein